MLYKSQIIASSNDGSYFSSEYLAKYHSPVALLQFLNQYMKNNSGTWNMVIDNWLENL